MKAEKYFQKAEKISYITIRYSDENLALEDKSMFCHFRPRTSESYGTVGRIILVIFGSFETFLTLFSLCEQGI